jgi:hypothetical protein
MTMLLPHEQQAQYYATQWDDPSYLRVVTPALFATQPHSKMSDSYAFTNTYELVSFIRSKGFDVHSVQQSGRGSFGKVGVKLSFNNTYMLYDFMPQLLLFDSHDGTKALSIRLGYYRFACANGMVIGDDIFNFSIRHNAPDIMAQARLAVEDAREALKPMYSNIYKLHSSFLSPDEALLIASNVTKDRFPDKEERECDKIAHLLTRPRRGKDARNDAFTTMNVIQENVMRGGMRYLYEGDVKTLRPITGLKATNDINESVWKHTMDIVDKRIAA